MSQGATLEGTKRYAWKFQGRAADGHFRQVQDLAISSLGIGTYLGPPDENTDASYAAALVAAVELEAGILRVGAVDGLLER